MFLDPVIDEGKRPGLLGFVDFVLYNFETGPLWIRKTGFFARLIPFALCTVLLCWLFVCVAQRYAGAQLFAELTLPPVLYYAFGSFMLYLMAEMFIDYRDSRRTYDCPLWPVSHDDVRDDINTLWRNAIGYLLLCVFFLLALARFQAGDMGFASVFLLYAVGAAAMVISTSWVPHNYHYSDYSDIAWRKGYTTFGAALVNSVGGDGTGRCWKHW